ncbi:MAG TPA: TonB C-terminal domain-containing protein [Vulgatibacter sp.]
MSRDLAARRGGRLRFGVAILASVLVHGSLLVALWMAPPPVRPHPGSMEQVPIEVVFLEALDASAGDAEELPGMESRPALPREGRGRDEGVGARPSLPASAMLAEGRLQGRDESPGGLAARSERAEPAEPAALAAEATQRQGDRTASKPAELAEEKTQRQDERAESKPGELAEGGAPGTRPEGSLTIVPEEGPPPVDDRFRLPRALDLRAPIAQPSPEETAPQDAPVPGGRQIERRLAELFAEDRAVETARSRADAYWLGLRQRMEKGFAPPMEIVEAGPGSGSAGMQGAIDSYRAQASAYAATGTPYGDDPLVPGGRRGFALEAADEVSSRVFGAPLPEAIGESSVFSRRLVAVVEVEQDRDGSLAGVRLVSSSGIPAYDRLALEQARDPRTVSAAELGPPPAQGRRTKWAFASTLRIIPPLPMAGCSIDAYFMPGECFWPLKKILRHRVSLLAIYDDREL